MDRLALSLRPGPRAVQEARRWIDATCARLGRDDLVECAQLGVSELVTNALLHGAPPIELQVRGTEESPRFEVRDASPEAPALPPPAGAATHSVDADAEVDPDADSDEVLLTFGRGLDIVARAAEAWGVDLEADGKVIWFHPARDVSEVAIAAIVTGAAATGAAAPQPTDPVTVQVIGIPPRLFTAFHLHLRELRREVRLLALSDESAHPLATDLSDLVGSLERHLRDMVGGRRLEDAHGHGAQSVDLTITMSRAATQGMPRFLELLDLADEFCREQRLLALARTPEQRQFQRWLLSELFRQGAGATAQPWPEADPGAGHRAVVS